MKNQELFGKEINWLTAIYFLVFGVLLVLTAHGDMVLWFNDRHTSFWDTFFKYWTYLGDGVLLGVLALVLLFLHYYKFLTFLLAIALQTAFVHVFKQWLSAGEPRPKTFFVDQIDTLNFVEGVTVRGYDSFPSGHTASGFVLFFFLILLLENKALKLLCFFTAVLVGLSRIYLLQHFARDVYVGSLFGILAVVLALFLMRNQVDKPKLQRGLLKR